MIIAAIPVVMAVNNKAVIRINIMMKIMMMKKIMMKMIIMIMEAREEEVPGIAEEAMEVHKAEGAI